MYLWQCILKIHVYMYYAKAWKYVFKNIRESLYKLKDKTCPCTRQRGGWWWCWFSPNWSMCSIAFHKYSDYFFFHGISYPDSTTKEQRERISKTLLTLDFQLSSLNFKCLLLVDPTPFSSRAFSWGRGRLAVPTDSTFSVFLRTFAVFTRLYLVQWLLAFYHPHLIRSTLCKKRPRAIVSESFMDSLHLLILRSGDSYWVSGLSESLGHRSSETCKTSLRCLYSREAHYENLMNEGIQMFKRWRSFCYRRQQINTFIQVKTILLRKY